MKIKLLQNLIHNQNPLKLNQGGIDTILYSKNSNPIRLFLQSLILAMVTVFAMPTSSFASHGQAMVSDIDHVGMGTFTGTYVHVEGAMVDHPWFVFNANPTDEITVTVTTHNWVDGSFVWVYQALDNCVEVGDYSLSIPTCFPLIHFDGYGENSYTFTISPGLGQFAIQLDSYLGGDGNYTVTISGSTAETELCTGSCSDACPDDPNKTSPGFCGCGVPETDTDNDGTPDCIDGCPEDPNKLAPGQCGCGFIDVDTDCDGVADCVDYCPGGDDSYDYDGDGVPDCKDVPPYALIPDDWKCGNNGNKKKNHKVLVCHIPKGNPANAHTICIDYHGVQAHLDLHGGDYLGPCGNSYPNCGGQIQKNKISKGNINGELFTNTGNSSDKDLNLYPNPTQNQLFVQLSVGINTPVQIQLFNSVGKPIFNQNYVSNEDLFVTPISVENYSNGLYFVKSIANGIEQVRSFSVVK